MSDGSVLLEVRNLVKTFGHPGASDSVTAVDGISMSLVEGETLGLVGESGSGKNDGRAVHHSPDVCLGWTGVASRC